MAYVCKSLVQDVCVEWVEYQSLLDQLAISRQEMYQLGSAIFAIYVVVIAFVAFNNFVKRA